MVVALQAIGRRIQRWMWVERGQTMAEYALILGAILLVAFAAFQAFGVDVQSPINATSDSFP